MPHVKRNILQIFCLPDLDSKSCECRVTLCTLVTVKFFRWGTKFKALGIISTSPQSSIVSWATSEGKGWWPDSCGPTLKDFKKQTKIINKIVVKKNTSKKIAQVFILFKSEYEWHLATPSRQIVCCCIKMPKYFASKVN